MSYIAKPKVAHPGLAKKQSRSYPARLRGHCVHVVRRVRTRLGNGGHHPGSIRVRRYRATQAGQDERHRLFVEDAGLLCQPVAWI